MAIDAGTESRGKDRLASSVHVTGAAQLDAWRERLLPPVERLRDDLWSIPVPMPHSPLRYTSVYALAGDSSITLVDAGWESEESWAALGSGLRDMGASPSDVTGVLVTHQHRDHVGLAGRLREATGAWIGMHPADRDALAAPDFRDPDRALAREYEWLRKLGASKTEIEAVAGTRESFAYRRSLALADRLLTDGDMLDLPGWRLRVLHTPGHTPGHLCFADEKTGLFFSGDHVLPRISPNVAGSRAPGIDLLGSYLRSLDKVATTPATEVLPAHEWRFTGLSARTSEIASHHVRRLAELHAVVNGSPGSTPWTLAAGLTWSRPWDQYDGRLRVTAVNETYAHLVHLVERGVIRAQGDDVPVYFSVVPR